jgi:hypothetical protein
MMFEVTYIDDGQPVEGVAVVEAADRFEAGECVMGQAEYEGVRRRLRGIVAL